MAVKAKGVSGGVNGVARKTSGAAECKHTAASTVAPRTKRAATKATKATTKKSTTSPDKKARLTAARPKALVQRVYNAIDGELSKLEKQKGASSQDRERASRALSQMVNSLEKAVEMQRELLKRSSSRVAAKDKEALRHAEDLRREIADRLDRLNRKRGARKSAQ